MYAPNKFFGVTSMATFTIEEISAKDGTCKLATWATLTEADTTPQAIEFAEHADRSVQVTGTFAAGTVIIEGSNDGTNWAQLNDPQGNVLSFTAAKIEQLLEVTRYMRPRVTAGTGVSVAVSMILRRASSIRT
jgi:hypothetical protein